MPVKSPVSDPGSDLSSHTPGGVPELLAIAFPMIISQACETLMMFVDRLFLARLGPEYMSAAMGGGLTAFMFVTFLVGLIGYSNALVAQFLGSDRTSKCAGVVAQSLMISIAGYPLVLAAIPAGHLLFRVSGIAPEQLAPQQAYFDLLMFGTVVGLARHCLASFFSGIGRTRIVMLSAMVAMVVNITANYLLIFGIAGFPAMGIRGAAIGTILGSAAGLSVLAGLYFSRAYRSAYGVVTALRFDPDIMKKLLRYGSPTGLEFLLNILAFNMLIMTFHSYGVNVAAAVTIAFNWDMVSFIPLIGVNIGVTSLVGRYMGANDPDTAQCATMSGLKIALAYSAITFTAFGLLPGPLVSVFRSPGAETQFDLIAPLAIYMVRLISVYVFANAVSIVFGGALRGAGDTFWAMCVSVTGHWLLAGVAIFMTRVLGAEPRVAWAVAVFLILGIGAALYLRYHTGKWRTMRVVGDVPAPLTGDVESVP